MFFLNALNAIEGKISRLYFSVDSTEWLLFAPPNWIKGGFYHFGVLSCYCYYKTPYTDPVYFWSPGYDEKRDAVDIRFFYLNSEHVKVDPKFKFFFKSNSAIAFYYPLTPDDYKIIESFQNTKRIPYLKSIALQIKTMPIFLRSELKYIKTDQNLLLELPMLALTVLFSIPYLYFQVVVPPSLSIPFFWLWIVFSIFYVVTPYSVLQKIGERINEIFRREKFKR